jgi:hypothetical protein
VALLEVLQRAHDGATPPSIVVTNIIGKGAIVVFEAHVVLAGVCDAVGGLRHRLDAYPAPDRIVYMYFDAGLCAEIVGEILVIAIVVVLEEQDGVDGVTSEKESFIGGDGGGYPA